MKQYGLKCVKCNTDGLRQALEQANYSMFKFGNVLKAQYIKEDIQFILKCSRQANGQAFNIQLENGLIVMGNRDDIERGCVVLTDATIIELN